MKTLLLTGWCGYIGSHNAVLFLQEWYEVIILDNFSNSNEAVLKSIEGTTGKAPKFYYWDIRHKDDIEKVFEENQIDGVIHFAGLKAVGESCEKPFEYYENNLVWSLHLFEVMEKYWVYNIIFSSSATVYNPLQIPPFTETTLTGNTTNPYGSTKFLIENILRDLASYKNFRVANLRYFNPIGAHESGLIWEDPNDIPNNLLPYIMKVASGELGTLSVFWDDYDTPDGTGVRDYIHVVDLANGHLAAQKWLENGASSSLNKGGIEEGGIFESFNLWTGRGTSVKEMIDITETVIGAHLPHTIAPRRSWDIASAYCNPEKAEKVLWWKAEKTVQEAIADSWNFIQNTKR